MDGEFSEPMHKRSIQPQSTVPPPTTVVVIQLDPQATLRDLHDDTVRKAAAAIQTKRYVAYTHEMAGFPSEAPWHTCQFRLIGRKLPKSDPEHGVEPNMCIPLLPNMKHPLGRTVLPLNKPLPWDSCYLHTFPEVEMRMPNVSKDSSGATFVPSFMSEAKYDGGPCEEDRMRQLELLEAAELVSRHIHVMPDDVSVASSWKFLVKESEPASTEFTPIPCGPHVLGIEPDTTSVIELDHEHSIPSVHSIAAGTSPTEELDTGSRHPRPELLSTRENAPPESSFTPLQDPSQEDLQDQLETPPAVHHRSRDDHALSSPARPSVPSTVPSESNRSFADHDGNSFISSQDSSESSGDDLDQRLAFSTLPMVDVEFDLSAISDFGEPEELLAELAAINAIEEAYYAAKNKEVVKPDVYEATAEASGQRFSFEEITSRLRRFLTGLKSVSSQRHQSPSTDASVSDDDSHHESLKSRTAADKIRERWELENPEKELATPLPSRLFRLKARIATARTRVGRTVRDAVCCA